MKSSYTLNFCFKGSRNYVQGPDIFDTVIKQLSQTFNKITKIKYTAYEMLYTNASLCVTDSFVKSDYPIINSLITFIHQEIKYYAVISSNDTAIECSQEYSEVVVQKSSLIQKQTISFQNTLNAASYTEIVVSMNKYFLSTSVDVEGKWIVTKFDYDNVDTIMNIQNQNLKIELVQNLSNKLTKSTLYLADKKVGNLYFTLIPKES